MFRLIFFSPLFFFFAFGRAIFLENSSFNRSFLCQTTYDGPFSPSPGCSGGNLAARPLPCGISILAIAIQVSFGPDDRGPQPAVSSAEVGAQRVERRRRRSFLVQPPPTPSISSVSRCAYAGNLEATDRQTFRRRRIPPPP